MMVTQMQDNGINLKSIMHGLISDELKFDTLLSGLQLDSRKVKNGDVFIALNGVNTNGNKFISDAIGKGAVAVLMESEKEGISNTLTVPVISVTNLKLKLGKIASQYYEHPSKDLTIVGVTGTNGKTSVIHFLAQILSDHGNVPVGSIGTLGCGQFNKLKQCANTTPDIITINQLLFEFRSQNIKNVLMEVSSIGLEQGRVNEINFETAVFTNLTRDHLDYHGDMSLYGDSKKKLFDAPGIINAVINVDDDFGIKLASEISSQINKIGYGIVGNHSNGHLNKYDVFASIKNDEFNSLDVDITSPWGKGEVNVPISGKYNVYNLLACLSVACLQGISFDKVLDIFTNLNAVPGRMEYFGKPTIAKIFIDYSHTPDALQQALISLRSQCKGKLICVFGCGGGRDRGKRSEMGMIAEQYADHIILTNDNPRTESAENIIKDIQSGMKGKVPVEINIDRSSAIRKSIEITGKDDYVLIAGKGHESYQEIGVTKHPYSDRQQVRNLLENLS
jgi:UDP-N-acetylmuramoyl-L-alanyl-D-glutamate--2,6-diaminopimelate ligase